jgi:hypothetical protein
MELWAPVLKVHGVTFYSLQVGPQAKELQEASRVPIEDLAPDLRDWAATAAAVAQLDLVISVDTGVAYLAGALGTPVWICLPASAEWRWGLEGCTTHWYAAARLFRQWQVGDWRQVFERLAEELRQLVAGGVTLSH